MSGGFKVEGADQLRTLAAELKVANRALRNRMLKGLRAAAAPAKTVIPEHERAVLPHSGGLGEWVASAEVKIRTSTTGRGAGVRVTQGRNSKGGRRGVSRSNLRLAEQQGLIRHQNRGGPGFSIDRRDEPGGWSSTPIQADWFTEAAESLGPGAEVAMRTVLDETARAAGFRGP